MKCQHVKIAHKWIKKETQDLNELCKGWLNLNIFFLNIYDRASKSHLNSPKCQLYNGRFSFDEKFRFQFQEISSDGWKSILWNFRKRGQPCDVKEISYREFTFHLTFLLNYLKFSGKWFAFMKFNNFRIFWKLSQEISATFVPVSKFAWRARNITQLSQCN